MVRANIEKIENGWIVNVHDPLSDKDKYFKTLIAAIKYADKFLGDYEPSRGK